MALVEITLERVGKEWWLDDQNNPDTYYQKVGPFNTKAEAAEAKKGLKDFWRNHHNTKPKGRKA